MHMREKNVSRRPARGTKISPYFFSIQSSKVDFHIIVSDEVSKEINFNWTVHLTSRELFLFIKNIQ